MSEWQKVLRDGSVDTLEKLAEKFGHDVIDVEALRPAFDDFQVRITPAALEQIKEVGDPMWNQYVPTVRELEIVDGVVDSLDEDGDSPVPNITHRYPDRVLFLVSPVCASLLPLLHAAAEGGRSGEDSAQPVRLGVRVHPRAHPEIRDVILSGGDPMMLSRPAHRVHPAEAARDSARRDHPHREPHHLAPARAHHAGVLRDGAEVPSDLHEHALQSSERAHARRRSRRSTASRAPAWCSAARRCCSRA